MTRAQFEFLMESIRWRNQKTKEKIDTIEEAELEKRELENTLKRLDDLEGKNIY